MKQAFRLLWLLLVVCRVHGGTSAPNVVILLADDLGWAGVGYHADWARTPNIDRLAREGIELDRFYVAPMCTPTRAGLMTGRYPIRFGLARSVIPPYRDFGLPVEEHTLPERLKERGYRHRGAFGKWHLGHHHLKWHPLSRGFTEFEGHYNGAIDYFTHLREGERDWHQGLEPSDSEGYATELIAQSASRFIRKAATESAPYFCYVAFNAPHAPFQARDEAIKPYLEQGHSKRDATYLAMIESMDRGIGEILKAIDDSGETDQTQVWFFSDNGGVGNIKGNNAPLRGSKLTTFEGGLRVAACVRWPDAWPGGRRVDHHLGYIDLMPTILASAGSGPEPDQAVRAYDGLDLGPVLTGKAASLPNRDWFSYHGQGGPDQERLAIHSDRWKLIIEGPDIRTNPFDLRQHQVHLFQIDADPLEKNDRQEQHPATVQLLYEKLKAHRFLQPDTAVPPYAEGKEGFIPWKDWRIPNP